MAGKFDFTFVQSQNLDLKFFPVNQAKVTFSVDCDTDPLTLQQMRDVCSDVYGEYRDKVNNFIKSRNGEIARLSVNDRRARKHVQLFESGNKMIQKYLDDFKKEADERLKGFARQQQIKEEKIANAPSTGGFLLKWGISVAWTMYQGGKGLFDMMGGEGPVKMVDGVKGFLGALTDLLGLLEKLRDQFSDEKAVNQKLRTALKNLASKPKFTEGDVKALEDLVNLYEARLLQMEVTSKSLSAKIAGAVTQVPRKDVKAEAQKAAEQELDGLLKGLSSLQGEMAKMHPQLRKYKIYLGAAKQQAKKQQTGWLAWLGGTAYDFKEAGFALWDKKLDEAAKELSEKGVDALIKQFSVPQNIVVH